MITHLPDNVTGRLKSRPGKWCLGVAAVGNFAGRSLRGGGRRPPPWGWYQTEPHAAFPPLPAVDLRIPKLQAVGGPGNFAVAPR